MAAPTRQRNRRGQGGRLREELVQAALRLLETAERETDVGIRAVTREAGVTPQAFYLQFASLDELLYAVYAIAFDELRETMAGAAASAAGAGMDRLKAVCRAYCAYAQDHPGRYRALTGVQGQQRHAGWEDQPLPGASAFAVIQEAVAAAYAEAPRAAATTAATLWASLHGVVTLRASRPAFPWPPLEAMLDWLLDAARS